VISWTALLILTASQVTALNQAYSEGSLYGIGRYFQAVILVESSACIHKLGDDRTSLGCSQLKLSTARKVCRCKLGPSRLTNQNQLNLRIGAQFLADCFARFYPNIPRALICYNAGEPKAATLTDSEIAQSKYVAKVKAYLRQLQQIPVSPV
jgi:Transglycosylase SLT domain